MIATAADGPCPGAYRCGGATALSMVPPPVELTVTMALTSRPPSGRYSFWYTSTENCGTFDFEKLAMPSLLPPQAPTKRGAMMVPVNGPVPSDPLADPVESAVPSVELAVPSVDRHPFHRPFPHG